MDLFIPTDFNRDSDFIDVSVKLSCQALDFLNIDTKSVLIKMAHNDSIHIKGIICFTQLKVTVSFHSH